MAVIVRGPPKKDIVDVDPLDLIGEDTSANVDENGEKILKVLTVCTDPKMSVVPDLVTEEEAQHLLELAEGAWVPSLVGVNDDPKTQKDDGDPSKRINNIRGKTRTSRSAMLRYAQTPIVEAIEHRIAAIAGLPVEQIERMNMVRYAPGEYFDEHHDGKFRPRTVFLYLNRLPEGDEGDTYFSQVGLRFIPHGGTAVVWSNAKEDGNEDSRMLHAGRAPKTGTKYGVNCFFNQKPMRRILRPPPGMPAEADAPLVDVSDLGGHKGEVSESDGAPVMKLTSFVIHPEPKICMVTHFLKEEQVQHLLKLAEDTSNGELKEAGAGLGRVVAGGRVRVLGAEETEVVAGVEVHFSQLLSLEMGHVGRLRLVRGPEPDAAEREPMNRGCGPKFAFASLAPEAEELHFKGLGMRVRVPRGAVIFGQNLVWSEDDGLPSEDLRTSFIRLPPKGCEGSVWGLQGYFSEAVIRDAWAAAASPVAAGPPEPAAGA